MTGFNFDEHMDRRVAKALIGRGYTTVMAVDVGMEAKDDDAEHLFMRRKTALLWLHSIGLSQGVPCRVPITLG